tara:strand:+ start:299 stop:529 length:231 start_codon:yes stop_codon:yes gene_type:complete
MIKANYSERDQARIDAANEAIDDRTKYLVRVARESGKSAIEATRLLSNDNVRRLMLDSLSAMKATMTPKYVEESWR